MPTTNDHQFWMGKICTIFLPFLDVHQGLALPPGALPYLAAKTATQAMRKRTPLLGATLLLLATLVVVDAKFRGCLSGYTSCERCCDVNSDCICDKVCGGNDGRWKREAAYNDAIGCSYRPPQGSGVQGCAAQYKACPSCCGVYAGASTRVHHMVSRARAPRVTRIHTHPYRHQPRLYLRPSVRWKRCALAG
jgi:hypothetical protein